jgi:PKD repeat protein
MTLTAYPVTGSGTVFNNWSGACTGETTPCTFTISSDTAVNAQFDLVSDFTATPTSGPVPLYVCFSDASVNDPASWLWDFGDGESADTRNPCHPYIAAGSYGVSLTSSGGGGTATRTISNYISASACANKPVRISGGSPFSDIQSACDKAANGDTIEVQALVFDGGLTLSNDATVILKGGYICDYSANPMFSTIHGPLTVGGGALSLGRVVIQ